MRFDSSKNSKSLTLVYGLTVLLFSVCIIFPLICVLSSAGLKDFKAVFTQQVWHNAMKNTLLECLASTSLSVFVGYIFAYAVVKTNIPGKKIFSLIPIIHLITPPFVGGLAFILLFGRQ